MNPPGLCVHRKYWLEVGPHSDLADPAAIFATGYDVFEETYACSPDVAVAAAELLKSSAYRHVRSKAIQNGSVLRVDNLGLHARIVFNWRESKLSRHQVVTRIKQSRRRRSIGQGSKQMRGADDLGEDRTVARCCPGDAIASLRIWRKYPEHRPTDAGLDRMLKICAVPIDLRETFVAIAGHTKLAYHQRFPDRVRSGHTIVDKLAERLRRIDKAISVVTWIIVNVAIVDAGQGVID